MHEPVYGNGEIVEDDHPGIILTGETVNGFSFFFIIMWFGIIVTGVVAIGVITIRTVITGTIVTGNIVLLVITDFFNKHTGGAISRGRAFLSREASKLRDGGRGAPIASKCTESSGTMSACGCDGFGGICVSSVRACLNGSGH